MNFEKCFRQAAECRYSDPQRYKAILGELYRQEELRRYNLLNFIGNNEGRIEELNEYYSRREAIIDWMVDWGWTTDSRNAALGLPTIYPMIPFLRQIEMIEWLYNHYLQQEGGLIEKSREMGATWLCCFVAVREWRYEEGFSAGFGSRKVTLVDDKDNPKAIFVKIRTIINTQPKFWLPEFDEKKHDKIANLINPVKGSSLSGEGGDDIGRGDRRSMYFVDEAAYLDHPQKVDSALSQTTTSQFDISSYCGPNHFYQKRVSGRVDVFVFDWRDDPRKNQEWHDHEEQRLDPVILAQEIDRNPLASVGNLFIPPEWVSAAVELDLPDWGVVSAGLDVAAGGKNKSSLAIKRGCKIEITNWNFKNGVDLTYKTIEECHSAGVDYLNYDPVGVGHSFYSTIDRVEFPLSFDHFAMNAGDSVSDKFYDEFGRHASEIFLNAKSEWWYNLSILFKNTWEFVKHGIKHEASEMISIPNNGQLCTELSTPKKIWKNNGKFMVESKEMLSERGVPSPDMADATVLACIAKDTTFKRVWPTYKNIHFRDTNISFKNIDVSLSQLYIVLHYDKDTGIYGNMFFWGRKSRALRVYAELYHPNPILEIVANDIREKAGVPLESSNELNPRINKIYANDDMFAGGNDWAYSLRTKGRIRVQKLSKYDESAAIMIARGMFANNQIIVDQTLTTTNQQYKNWRIVKNQPADGYPFCKILCMALSELREKGELADADDAIIRRRPYSKEKQRIRDRMKVGKNPYLTNDITQNRDENEYLMK